MPKFINMIDSNKIPKKSISFRSHYTNGYEFSHLHKSSFKLKIKTDLWKVRAKSTGKAVEKQTKYKQIQWHVLESVLNWDVQKERILNERKVPVKVTALVFPFSHCLNHDTFHYLQHYPTILNPGHKISKTRKEKTGNVICFGDSHPFFVSFCIS